MCHSVLFRGQLHIIPVLHGQIFVSVARNEEFSVFKRHQFRILNIFTCHYLFLERRFFLTKDTDCIRTVISAPCAE